MSRKQKKKEKHKKENLELTLTKILIFKEVLEIVENILDKILEIFF